MTPAAIVPDGVYVDVGLNRWRRVIAIHYEAGPGLQIEKEVYVLYSLGTDTNRWCLLRTFCRWAHKRITVDEDGMIEEYEQEAA